MSHAGTAARNDHDAASLLEEPTPRQSLRSLDKQRIPFTPIVTPTSPIREPPQRLSLRIRSLPSEEPPSKESGSELAKRPRSKDPRNNANKDSGATVAGKAAPLFLN